MAHPCFNCGSECDCHGDIDDCIVSKTPNNCDGCGCVEDREESREAEYFYDDEFDRELSDWENEQERRACTESELEEEDSDE